MKRIILDEGVPRPLARALRERGIDCAPFPNEWKQLTNGLLLDEIERLGFEILITNDKKMSFQQSMAGRNLAVLILPDNKLRAVLAMIPEIVPALESLRSGEFTPLRPSRDSGGRSTSERR